MNATLVIGIGNTLRGDDGAGVQAVERLAALFPAVDCMAVQQLHPEIAETLSRYDRVYFIDASISATAIVRSTVLPRTGVTTGTGPEQAAHEGTHSLSPTGLLLLCSSLYERTPRTVTLVEIPAEQFAFGTRLSDRTAAMVESAVRSVGRALSTSGR